MKPRKAGSQCLIASENWTSPVPGIHVDDFRVNRELRTVCENWCDDARNVEPDDDLNVACKEILKVWGLGSSCRT